VELLRKAAPLHDIGKIGISDLILLKPGKLTDEEFETMKAHSIIGGDILVGSHFPLLQMAEVIARTHHERWDGLGYYEGLKGEEIPLEGRILAVVDVFDALTNERPYKASWDWPAAVEEIRRCSGTQFDPKVVEAFLQLIADGVIHEGVGQVEIS
jgi:putative two-component system response regulator